MRKRDWERAWRRVESRELGNGREWIWGREKGEIENVKEEEERERERENGIEKEGERERRRGTDRSENML